MHITTATNLRQNTANIINNVYYQKQPIIIERHGKPFVKIVPIEEEIKEKLPMKSKLNKYFGSIPDLEIRPTRSFRDKDLNL